jgi:GH24 family phage-related lysozyme (muramidase)
MRLEDFLIREEGDDSRRLPNGDYASTFDPLGRCWNIGTGITVGVTKDTVWTPAELQAHEDAEFAGVKAQVASLVKVPLGENRMTVLESFTFNCGFSALAHSSILKSVNAGNFDAVPAELRQWTHAKGAAGPVPGLIKRRNDEVKLWNTPDTETAAITTSKNVPAAMTSAQSDIVWLTHFQTAHGLVPDGDAGPLTLHIMRTVIDAATLPHVAPSISTDAPVLSPPSPPAVPVA